MNAFEYGNFQYFSNLDAEIEDAYPLMLKISEKSSPEYILFRLLLGTLDFNHSMDEDHTDKYPSQRIDFSVLTDTFEDRRDGDPINRWLGNGPFSIEQLEEHFKNNRENSGFFRELLIEFSLALRFARKGNNIAAFVHIYRALEHISYILPLVYASLAKGYLMAFDAFRSFFTDKNTEQLKFFRNFVENLMDQFVKLKFSIDTQSESLEINNRKRHVIEKLCKSSKLEPSMDGSVVVIEYRYVIDFLVTIRNRFFHFQSDRNENIRSTDFDLELFFYSLNYKFINWIAMIYLEILEHFLSRGKK